MNQKKKGISIGRRTIKTAVAVILSLMVVSAYGTSTSKMIFAMIGAMNAMETTFRKSVESCLTQIIGMICGAMAGLLLMQLPIPPLVSIGIGIVFIITLYNIFGVHFSPVLPCLIIVTVCTTPEIQPVIHVAGRLWDTAIGLGIGMLINVLVFPYDNSYKIRNLLEYLEKEVIDFLEDMFDGDDHYPDTEEINKTMREMEEQLDIFSQQWIPTAGARSQKRLEVLRTCEGKARQLLARMEVLSRVERLGRLSEDNKKKLKECGAVIRDNRILENAEELDIVTNYHVTQILKLRKELMETLERFPQKKRGKEK